MALVMKGCSFLGTPVQRCSEAAPPNIRRQGEGDVQNAGRGDPRIICAVANSDVRAIIAREKMVPVQ